MEKEEMNLYQKLAKVREMVASVKKTKKGHNNTYADITEILAKVTAMMNTYRISLIPSIVPGTAETKQATIVNTKIDKAGNVYDSTTTEWLTKADMMYRWVNQDNPEEYIDVSWFVTGMQSDPSQAFGAGLTYCSRYFLANYFQLAQTDLDVDAYRKKQKETVALEERMVAEEIISQIDTLIRSYLDKNPEKGEEVKRFIGNYERNSNYKAIKDPNLAAKLLSEFKKTFIKEE